MSVVPPRAQGRSEHWQWQQRYWYLCQSEHLSEHTLLWCGELYCKTQKAATYNDVSVLRKNLGFWINIIRREMSGCAQILHAEPVMCVTVCACHILTCMAKSEYYNHKLYYVCSSILTWVQEGTSSASPQSPYQGTPARVRHRTWTCPISAKHTLLPVHVSRHT